MPEVKLVEAIALSLNIEPEKIHTYNDTWRHPFYESDEFNDRLAVLQANIENECLFPTPSFLSKDDECLCGVHLNEFSLWASSIGWTIPEQLSDLAIAKVTQPKAQVPAEAMHQGVKWRKAFEYKSEGLNALYDLIELHFFDANGNPIVDAPKWPLKKELSSTWLTGRTLDEADTIITSRKRKGKAEK